MINKMNYIRTKKGVKIDKNRKKVGVIFNATITNRV